MNIRSVVGILFVGAGLLRAQTASGSLWTELQTKREKLPSFHQEFEVLTTFNIAGGHQQSSKRQLILDQAGSLWREKSISGSGNQVRVFDGADIFTFEDGDDEFLRAKHSSKERDLLPRPYFVRQADWPKATELERHSCEIPGSKDICVLLNVPIKPSMAATSTSGLTNYLGGTARVVLDTENGLLLQMRVVQNVEPARGSGYQRDESYTLKRFSQGTPPDAKIFELPSHEMREVKELSRWDAAKIRKRLAGNAAPELTLTDIGGKPVALADAKGKTVLLDFFTTWCPPCRADAPALDHLYEKYGEKDLLIVGISVSEDHAVVEKFLSKHPHPFPVALTSENEMPRPYQIGLFPTYVVIDKDGTLTSAVEGEKGFADLKKLLKKAGLEVD